MSLDNFERFYDKTVQIRVGAEYQFKRIDAYTRVGYMHDPIPFNAKEIKSNRRFLTLGVGKVFDEVVKFDIALHTRFVGGIGRLAIYRPDIQPPVSIRRVPILKHGLSQTARVGSGAVAACVPGQKKSVD